MPRYPKASSYVETLSDRVYSALVAEARLRKGPVHPLNLGDTYLDPLPVARAEAQLSSEHARLHNYSPVQGEPALLEAIVAYLGRRHGQSVEKDRIQVMSGATGGFTVAATALLEPGDEVVVLAPYWPLIRGIICSRGALAVEVPFYDRIAESDFDPEKALRAAISERTVAIYVNSPNNPTGQVLDESVLSLIAGIARKHDLWVLCDEAYESFAFGQSPEPLWLRPEIADRALAFHTLSKSYALGGARVGYTHGPREIMEAIRGTQTFLTYAASRPMQLGGARALNEGDEWSAEVRRLYAETGTRAAKALGLPPPAGGTFLFFDASPYFEPGEDIHGFLRRCLDVGVLLTPGAASGKDYESWVRLCFTAVPPAELDDALERLVPVFRRRG